MAISVGEVEATLRLKDEFSESFRKGTEKMESLELMLKKLGHDLDLTVDPMHALTFAFSASVGAVVALTAAVAAADVAIMEMAEKGSKINDVELAFERLTKGMGVDAHDAIEKLKTGTKGLVDDFELMKLTNKAMGAGLHLTADEFETVGGAARALAKQTGKDVPEAFALVMAALTTGRARSLQAAGAFIELKGASAELKQALSAEGESMSTGTELAAKRKATLEALSGILHQSGDAERSFGEQITAAGIAIGNWFDELNKAIAASPALNALLRELGDVIQETFGPGAAGLIRDVVEWVEFFARAQVEVGKTVLTVADIVDRGWNVIRAVVLGTTGVIVGALAVIVTAMSKVANIAAMVSPFNDSLQQMSVASGIAADALQEMTDGLGAETIAALEAVAGHGAFQDSVAKGHATLDRLSTAMQKATDAAGAHHREIKAITTATTEGIEATAEQLKAIRELQQAEVDLSAMDQIIVLNQVAKGNSESLVAKALNVTEAQVKRVIDIEKLRSDVELKGAEAGIKVHEKWAANLEQFTDRIVSSMMKATLAERDYTQRRAILMADSGAQILQEWTDALNKLGAPIQGFETTWREAVDAIDQYFGAKMSAESMAAATKAAGTAAAGGFAAGFSRIVDDVPKLLKQAFSGGGGAKGAAQALGVDIAESLGKGLAQSKVGQSAADGLAKAFGVKSAEGAGAIASGVTSLFEAGIGLAIGAVGKLFGKLFANPEKQINPIREAFVQAAGGLSQLNARAQEAGVTLTALLNAKNPEAYKKAIDDLNAAFAFQDKATATLSETIKKYGFSFDELGPAWQRQELDKKAQELYQDFRVLQSAGIDVETITQRMADATNTYVQQAIKMGIEVPSAMKPMLQRMMDMGLLTDAGGNKIEDFEAAGVRFSETLSEGFSRVVTAVEKLAAAIARSLGVALDDVTRKADTAADAMDRVSDVGGRFWKSGDEFPSGEPAAPILMAAGGVGHTTGPTTFFSAGDEDFAFSGEGRSFGNVRASGSSEDVLAALEEIRAELALQRSILPVAIRDSLQRGIR